MPIKIVPKKKGKFYKVVDNVDSECTDSVQLSSIQYGPLKN